MVVSFSEKIAGQLYDWGGGVYNVKHPKAAGGAKGDGVTDDTAAIDAWALAGRGAVLIAPPADYVYNGTLLVPTERTTILARGARFLYQGTGTCVDITGENCVVDGLWVRASGGAASTGLILQTNANLAQLLNVRTDCAAGSSFSTGIDLTVAQNLTMRGGLIQANSGNGITDCIVARDLTRGASFFGVSITGHGGGTLTNSGLRILGDASIHWFGGVVQGGFAVAGFDVGTPGASARVFVYTPHVEQTAGAGSGYLYDNCSGQMTVVGTRGGSVSVGPTANAFDFMLVGGNPEAITLGSFAQNAIIMPSSAAVAIVDNGANTFIGQHRVTGTTIPEAMRYRRIRGRESALTFAANITVNASLARYFTLTVPNAGAITFDNPTNPQDGQLITIDIFNNSGGAMGAVTWGTEYKLAGSFTNPANGQHRLITYYRQGGAWREVDRSTADQPD